MKKTVIRIIVTALVAVFLLPMAFGVGLQEVFGILSGSSLGSNASYAITFYNTKNKETSLYVRKEIVDENGGDHSEDEFEYVLKLNGSIAEGQFYRLLDEEGRNLYYYEDGLTPIKKVNENGEPVLELALMTDENGQFTLKDGWTAIFDNLAQGTSYDVEEIPLAPYEQILPAGGEPAVGTVLPEGTLEVFRNLYPEAKEGTLNVRKSVSYPENYQIPETPDFTFRIAIAGKALADQEFTVKSISTDAETGSGKTNASGQFTLKGDTYAVFEGIPADVDYKVEELADAADTAAGWRQVGESVKEGATSEQGVTLNFTNALASFAVSKEMLGGTAADEPFSFQVLDGNGKAWSGSLKYYLYSNTLQLVDADLHETGTDGTFTLKAGQRAVFVGLEKGTAYGVRETSSGRYIQYLPADGAGYTGKTVTDSVEVLPFINAELPAKSLLTVRKKIVDNTENGSAPDVEFTFRINRLVDGEYVPVANAAYDIIDANGTRTLSADAEGVFKLRAWETARFVELKKGETYQVEELTDKLPRGFTVGGSPEKHGELGDDVLEIELENNYQEPENPYVAIRKENVAGKMLSGATLRLIKKNKDGSETILHEWASSETAEEFQVPVGTYFIREMEAPKSYEVAEDVEITVKDEYGEPKTGPNGETYYVQTFTMVDKRDTDVPTGVEAIKKPIVRTVIVLVILLAAAAAGYFGFVMRKRRGHGGR